ncbi:MAG: hypothetical protein ACRBN8_13585 [Nannocystales bacterium]
MSRLWSGPFALAAAAIARLWAAPDWSKISTSLMTDRSTKHPSEVDDLLAPPPFGVAETTGDQLLPIATSMEQVLDEDQGSLAEPEPQREPITTAAPEPKAPPSQPTPLAPAAAIAAASTEPPAGSGRTLMVAAVAVLLLGAAVFAWMRGGGDVVQPHSDAPRAGAVASAADGTPDTIPAHPVGDSAGDAGAADPPPSAPAVAPLPTELDELRKLSFEARHAGLASAPGDVPVELHVGLDLVQAQQSEEPCRTFSDALSIIESSEDPEAFKWALDEASIPTDDVAPSCGGLAKRLAAARGASGEVDKPRPRSRPSRSKPRSKPRPSRPTRVADSTPPAKSADKAEPAKPSPPPAREPPSVATKLDDDLRGLGE